MFLCIFFVQFVPQYFLILYSAVLILGHSATLELSFLLNDPHRLILPRQLQCRREMSDRPRLANQHAQMRHITLSIAISFRQFRIMSDLSVGESSPGLADRTRLRERQKKTTTTTKNVPANTCTWEPPYFCRIFRQ